ncbi:hypothetical protein J6590_047105 [Homalodisca vitripennis]|nr:hypothetical protein J6590_047105 [Homalodisca vitripennis]
MAVGTVKRCDGLYGGMQIWCEAQVTNLVQTTCIVYPPHARRCPPVRVLWLAIPNNPIEKICPASTGRLAADNYDGEPPSLFTPPPTPPQYHPPRRGEPFSRLSTVIAPHSAPAPPAPPFM